MLLPNPHRGYSRARQTAPFAQVRFKAMIKVLTALFLITNSALAETIPDCGIYTYRAEIVRVIDGDTVVADIDLGFDVWLRNEHLRLYRVQAPERGTAGFDASKLALAQRVEGRETFICTVRMKTKPREATGSFGRYLVTIYVDDQNVNEWLIGQGLASAYDQ